MRLVVSGTHGVGKSTLIEDFLGAHGDYLHEQEPYWTMAQTGIPFSDGANIPDLEEQLRQSIALIRAHAADPNVIFDRCPLDFVAYLEVVAEGEGFEWAPHSRLLADMEAAMGLLDLVVFVPLMRPDAIRTPIEQPALRRAVNARLQDILNNDELEILGGGRPRVLEVGGSREVRVAALNAAVSGL